MALEPAMRAAQPPDRRDKKIRDLEVSRRAVTLAWSLRRMACDNCHGRFLEDHPAFEGAPTGRLARRLATRASGSTPCSASAAGLQRLGCGSTGRVDRSVFGVTPTALLVGPTPRACLLEERAGCPDRKTPSRSIVAWKCEIVVRGPFDHPESKVARLAGTRFRYSDLS